MSGSSSFDFVPNDKVMVNGRTYIFMYVKDGIAFVRHPFGGVIHTFDYNLLSQAEGDYRLYITLDRTIPTFKMFGRACCGHCDEKLAVDLEKYVHRVDIFKIYRRLVFRIDFDRVLSLFCNKENSMGERLALTSTNPVFELTRL